MTVASFHFHGYQPGDVLRWTEPDPLKPPRFEERRSPVALRIGGERVSGQNWTDAVLRAYGRIERVLHGAAGAASVDIEPQTLVWLLERDPDAYSRVLAAWRGGAAGLAMTPPFHPFLPHHHRVEREALFEMMLDFYAPILPDRAGPIGLWFPEAGYTAEALDDYLDAARRAAQDDARLPDLVRGTHLLLDARQLAAEEEATTAWARTGLDGGIRFAARDPGLSGEFAFGGTTPDAFARSVVGRRADSILIASDLESLLANPAQGDRFAAIVEQLRGRGVTVAAPAPPDRPMAAGVLDFSSWSDYDEHLFHGRTSDTRWTGLRRSDGAVVSRVHRDEPLSQLWKHGFTLLTEQVETAVRRTAREILKAHGVDRPASALRGLAVAYGRHLFEPHFRACGLRTSELGFEAGATEVLRGRVDVEMAGFLARAYVTMLMGLRSDPRFWDAPDTRVTFQNVACLARALVDASEASRRSGDSHRGERLLRLLRVRFFDFAESYSHLKLAEFHGSDGWETAEGAWIRSMQSEVPKRSQEDVVRRAARYSVGEIVSLGPRAGGPRAGPVADAGHIVGEAHGEWENPEWCEHRT